MGHEPELGHHGKASRPAEAQRDKETEGRTATQDTAAQHRESTQTGRGVPVLMF